MKIMTLLIADSGSTKTDWRLVLPGESARSISTDGFNPHYQTTDQIAATLGAQLLPELDGAVVTDVFFYGAGCSGPSVNVLVADAIRLVLPDVQTVAVESDVLGAARATAGHEPGICCILGTGSNACCYDGTQITRGIQSLGFWLGDEGSGGYLGKTLVRDFFQQRLPPDLNEQFAVTFALDRQTLLENAYRKPFPNRYFASFTPFLSANISHPYVEGLLRESFTLFLTTYVRRFPEAAEWPVHFVGSIAYVFAESLRLIVQQQGLIMGIIVKAPAGRLVDFHRPTT